MRCSSKKRPSLLSIQHGHFFTLLTRKLNSLRRICGEELPTYRLPNCRPQNGMRVSNGSCREFPVDHDLICGLDFKRRERGQDSCTDCWTDVSTQHGCVVAVCLCADFRFHGRFQPVIQEFVHCDLEALDTPRQVSFV